MKKLDYLPIIGEVIRLQYNNTENFNLYYVLNIHNNTYYLYDGNKIIAVAIQHTIGKDSETGESYNCYEITDSFTICEDCHVIEADYILKIN